MRFVACVKIRNGALEIRLDGCPKRQSVTESVNINILENQQICSTIRASPENLPEFSFKDRGPPTKVIGAVSSSDFDIGQGGWIEGATFSPSRPRFWSW